MNRVVAERILSKVINLIKNNKEVWEYLSNNDTKHLNIYRGDGIMLGLQKNFHYTNWERYLDVFFSYPDPSVYKLLIDELLSNTEKLFYEVANQEILKEYNEKINNISKILENE